MRTLIPTSSARVAIGALLTLALVLAFWSAVATPASAAPYSVYSCQGPTLQLLPNSAWAPAVVGSAPSGYFTFGNVCGTLSVDVSTSGAFSDQDGAQYSFTAPAGTTIAGYSLQRSASTDFVSPNPNNNPQVSVGVREVDGPVQTDVDCDAVQVGCSVPESEVARSGLALSGLAVGAYCVDSSGCAAGLLTDLSTTLAWSRVDLEDSTPPTVDSVGGPLTNGAPASGISSVNVNASDVGGGVASVSFSVDGGAPQVRAAGGNCTEPYVLPKPCPSTFSTTIAYDTGQLTPGQHVATVGATDAAGNVANPVGFIFTVASAAPDPGLPVNGVPAVERPLLKNVRAKQTSSSGGRALVAGVLRSQQGQPIAGAKLAATALDLGVFGAKERSLGEVTTAADGRYELRVRLRGAQRVTFGFRPAPNVPVTAVSSTVVREDLSLSIKRSKAHVNPGGLLKLSGRLRGAGAAADGAPVEIDVKIDGEWRAVGVVEASKRGIYKWHYRFKRVTEPTRFIFRVQVRSNKSWPWRTETSKAVKVLVA